MIGWWPVAVRAFFGLWFSFTDKLLFAQHHWIGEIDASDGPILLLANHTSWWDGVWVWQQNRRVWKFQWHVPMLAQSLQRWPFLKHLGGLPLSKGKALAPQADAILQACSTHGQMLLLFPEGQIRRTWPGQHVFEQALLKRLLQPSGVKVVFLYQVIVGGNTPRPEVFHFLQPTMQNSPEALQLSYADFSAACEGHIAALWAKKMQRL